MISANKSNQQPWNLIIAELAPPHAQSARESRGEMVWAAELTACCNYFSKKKKNYCSPSMIVYAMSQENSMWEVIIDPKDAQLHFY